MCNHVPDGSKPDLTFYFSVSKLVDTIESFSFGSTLIVTKTGPLFADEERTVSAGKFAFLTTIFDTDEPDSSGMFNSTTVGTFFLPQGTITYHAASPIVKDSEGIYVFPEGTLIDPLIAGTKDFLLRTGFIATLVNNETLSRVAYIYFNPCDDKKEQKAEDEKEEEKLEEKEEVKEEEEKEKEKEQEEEQKEEEDA